MYNYRTSLDNVKFSVTQVHIRELHQKKIMHVVKLKCTIPLQSCNGSAKWRKKALLRHSFLDWNKKKNYNIQLNDS